MNASQIGRLAGALAENWQATMSSAAHTNSLATLLKPEGLRAESMLLPSDLATAYAVQEAMMHRIGPVAGWKVGRSPLGVTCAPIFSQVLIENSATARLAPIYSDLEAEVAYQFGSTLSPRSTPYTAEEVKNAIVATHVSMELLTPRIHAADDTDTRLLTLADGLACGALIIGTGVPGYIDASATPRHVMAQADDMPLASNPQGLPPSPVEDLLPWLANHLNSRGLAITANDWVTTGSWVGKLPLQTRTRLSVCISGIGKAIAELSP